MTFKDGTTVLGTGTLAAGVATFATPTLSAGSHPITAAYNGDTNFGGSTSPVLTQTVNGGKVTPNVVLTVSPNPATVGQTVTFTVKVEQTQGYPVPTGSVTISSSTNGNERYGNANLNADGVGTVTYTGFEAHPYSLVATYGGDNQGLYYNGAQSNTVSLIVNPATGSSAVPPLSRQLKPAIP